MCFASRPRRRRIPRDKKHRDVCATHHWWCPDLIPSVGLQARVCRPFAALRACDFFGFLAILRHLTRLLSVTLFGNIQKSHTLSGEALKVRAKFKTPHGQERIDRVTGAVAVTELQVLLPQRFFPAAHGQPNLIPGETQGCALRQPRIPHLISNLSGRAWSGAKGIVAGSARSPQAIQRRLQLVYNRKRKEP
jgi:hypothetical protein